MTSFPYLRKITSETRYFSYVTFINLQTHLVITVMLVFAHHYITVVLKALPYMVVHYYHIWHYSDVQVILVCKSGMQFYQHFRHKAALVQETLFEKEGKLILVQEGIFPGTNCVKNEILEVFSIKHLAIKTPALLL